MEKYNPDFKKTVQTAFKNNVSYHDELKCQALLPDSISLFKLYTGEEVKLQGILRFLQTEAIKGKKFLQKIKILLPLSILVIPILFSNGTLMIFGYEF